MEKNKQPSGKVAVAIFASGRGSNARKIIEHFDQHPGIKISLIVSNRPGAGVLDIADEYGIPKLVITRQHFYQSEGILTHLSDYNINFIVLAGFLWLIPEYLVNQYPQQIVNIHPALLPDFGGKGMYGMHVHRAVFEAKRKRSGITIHYVNAHYDEGDFILQAFCELVPDDSPEVIAGKVLNLEHFYYPRAIENLLS